MLHSQAVHLAREFIAEFFEQILAQQLLLKRFEDAGFDFVAANGQQVVAPALITCAEAGEPVAPGHDESGAADTAFVSPENRYCGRRARPRWPADFTARRVCS